MTAAPVIEAVRRAGGTILVHGGICACAAAGHADRRGPAAQSRDPRLGQLRRLSPRGTASASPVETSIERWRRGVERLSSMRRLRAIRSAPGPSSWRMPSTSWTAGDTGGASRLAGLGAVRLSPPGAFGRIQGWRCSAARRTSRPDRARDRRVHRERRAPLVHPAERRVDSTGSSRTTFRTSRLLEFCIARSWWRRPVQGLCPMSERASPKAASVAASLSEQLRDATTGALGTHCRRWR